jgi:hypothetical protein
MQEARGSNPLSSTKHLKVVAETVDVTDVTGRLRPSPFPHHAAAVHRLLLEHTTASLELSRTGTVDAMEPGVGALLGLRPEEVLDQRFVDLIDPADRYLVERHLDADDHTHPHLAVRLTHGAHLAPINLELTLVKQSTGHRAVLSDVLSWRMVERGAGEVANFGELHELSSAFVLRLDQQCRIVAANQAWSSLTGPLETDTGLAWLNALDAASIDAFRLALPGLCNGSSFESGAYVRSSTGRIDRVSLAACSLLTPTRDFAGFLIVGCGEPPLSDTEAVLVRNTIRFRVSPKNAEPEPSILATEGLHDALIAHDIDSTPQSAGEPAPISAEPDPMTRLAIASVLAAARTSFSGFAEDEPGLFDAPNSVEEIQSLLVPTRLDPSSKADLIDHLDAYHEDGMDAVVTVALLFIDVTRDAVQATSEGTTDTVEPLSGQDHDYELKVLERRLRTAVRDHEYAAPLDSSGFVVAARGAFGKHDLEALALRLLSRLEAPLRGYGSTGGPVIAVTGVCSQIGETDEELIVRAESARHTTLSERRRLHLIQ